MLGGMGQSVWEEERADRRKGCCQADDEVSCGPFIQTCRSAAQSKSLFGLGLTISEGRYVASTGGRDPVRLVGILYIIR